MAYAAKQEGRPGYCAICVDRPEWKNETAKTIAEWVRDGLTVEHKTLDDAKYGLDLYAAARRSRTT